MIHFTREDRQMMDHVVDTTRDRMLTEGGYTEQDWVTMTKLECLAKEGSAVVVSGRDTQDTDIARTLLQRLVEAELDNWVPNASQRLLHRAGAALGIEQPDPARMRNDDCGPDLGKHATVPDWVGDLFVRRCVSCARIWRV